MATTGLLGPLKNPAAAEPSYGHAKVSTKHTRGNPPPLPQRSEEVGVVNKNKLTSFVMK